MSTVVETMTVDRPVDDVTVEFSNAERKRARLFDELFDLCARTDLGIACDEEFIYLYGSMSRMNPRNPIAQRLYADLEEAGFNPAEQLTITIDTVTMFAWADLAFAGQEAIPTLVYDKFEGDDRPYWHEVMMREHKTWWHELLVADWHAKAYTYAVSFS